MDAMFGAIGPKAKSSGLNMARMVPAASLDWPQREPCNNLSDQIQLTTDQASILLNSIAKAPAWGSMTQMNRASVINFISNIQRMCEMIPDPDSVGLHTEINQLNRPAGAHSSSQQDVLQTLEEIKRLKQDMDRKVAAVEAAIKPRENSIASGSGNVSGTSSDTKIDGQQATAQNPLHMPVFGALGWSEYGKTYSMHATQAPVELRKDVPILGTSRLTRHSTENPNSDIQASGEIIIADAGTVLSTVNPGNGAESLTDVAPAGAENFPKVSDFRATGESLTAMTGHSNTHHTVAPTSGSSSNPKPIEIQPSMPDSHVQQAGDAVVESNTHSSDGQAADESVSGSDSDSDSDSDNRSSTDRTATASGANRAASSSEKAPRSLRSRQISNQKAPSPSGQAVDESESYSDRSSSIHPSATASSSNEEASESTERVRTDANSRVVSNQTAVESTIRASESTSAIPLPQEFGDGTDDEDSDDDGTDKEDSNDESSADEDTRMDDTETSEQSEESDAPQPKPIEIWRKGIAKPESTAVPKSVRAVSPSTTIPAPPIKRITGWLRIRISIRDYRIKSELKRLTQPELKCRIEREIVTTKSRIQRCTVIPSGDIRLYTTDFRGNRALQKPSSWRPGAFGKGASVLAHHPKRNVLLP